MTLLDLRCKKTKLWLELDKLIMEKDFIVFFVAMYMNFETEDMLHHS